MKIFMRNLRRLGIFSAATVVGLTVSAAVTQQQANAAICGYQSIYQAPISVDPGGFRWAEWSEVSDEADGSFVFNQDTENGIIASAIDPAYDATNKYGYVTVTNVSSGTFTYSGWFNIFYSC